MRCKVKVKRTEKYVQMITVDVDSLQDAMNKVNDMIENGEVTFNRDEFDYANEEVVGAYASDEAD